LYSNLAIIEMGFCLILFFTAWLATKQSLQLRRSGTAERLHRKCRKLLYMTGWLTLSAFIVLICIGWMITSLPSLFWEDRLTLNVPLIVAPLLAILFTTVPMLFGLWKETSTTSGKLPDKIKHELRSRLFVLPYQATALGAATSFYCTLISPIPYDKLKVTAPLILYVVIMVMLWLQHDRRFGSLREWLRTRRTLDLEEDSPETRTQV